ncbi:isochorismatase family protein [Paenibacillus woosongensis]|uniref:isochorismatase n=1 Tax=Paenibacillus woosongensis TaxID=307580 RepID=A0A7X2YXF1_9BACL|nr:isochorismatase family protein [Paenibacillus woosongensis]MUG43520.1 isochorismatase family protein [Paenibacillus woosongensis]
MGIPAIFPYSMPAEAELPANKVAWRPDPQRAVLLIHDMQNYFLKPYNTAESPIAELFSNIPRIRSECAKLGIPVVYSAQLGGQRPDERGLLQDFWGPGIGTDPFEAQIAAEVAPGIQDILMTKWRYSAFQRTDLLEWMREQARDQLIVSGIYAHIGCLLTSCEAFMQDIQPFFVADAVADFSLEKHKLALTYAAERCAVTLTTQRLLAELNSAVSANEPGGYQEHSFSSSFSAQSARSSLQATASANQVIAASRALAVLPSSYEQLRQQVAELLQEAAEEIGGQDNLVELWGLDSIRIMSLAERFSRGGEEIAFAELAEGPTLENWWQLLSARVSPSIPNVDYFSLGKEV